MLQIFMGIYTVNKYIIYVYPGLIIHLLYNRGQFKIKLNKECHVICIMYKLIIENPYDYEPSKKNLLHSTKIS